MKCLATTRDYCLECLSGTDRCSRCYDDFHPNELGECVQCQGNTGGHNCEKTKCNGKISENCATCYSAEDAVLEPGACKVCRNGYYKESDTTTVCTPCPDNRLSNGIVCTAVLCFGTRQENCQTCAEIGTACQLCFNGYGPNETGSCTPCPDGRGGPNCVGTKCTADQMALVDDCRFCRDDGACVQCATGFKLDNKECVPINGCQSPNCRSCTVTDGTETCKRCQKGYYVVSGRCVRCVGNCLDCKGVGVCVACEDGYTLTADVCVLSSPDVDVGSCNISNCVACLTNNQDVCATCSSGYLWNANERACVVACPDTNCIDCNQSTGECSACAVGYGMQEALCYPCTVSNCSSCAFRKDSKTGKSIEVCTQCSFGEVTAYGQCGEVVRVGKRTVLISSVSATALVLLMCIGIGLFFIFRRRSPKLDTASEALPVETPQGHEISHHC